MKKNAYKRWILLFIICLFLPMGAVAFTNWLVDPLWCFQHSVPFAPWRRMSDIRQQKTNYLVFRRPVVRTLVLGSSRMMYTEPSAWGPFGFNYAVLALVPVEYALLLRNVRDLDLPVEKILLGLDFSGACEVTEKKSEENIATTRNALATALKPGYRFAGLFNWQTFQYSVKTLMRGTAVEEKDRGDLIRYDDPEKRLYFASPRSEAERRELFLGYVEAYRRIYQEFIYDEDLVSMLTAFRDETADVQLIPLLVPVGTPLLRLIARTPGRLDDYERWIREIVAVFGGVWSFKDANSVARNPLLWSEPSHHSPTVGSWIVDRVQGSGTPPDDFGIYVTKENVDEYIEKARKSIERLLFEKDAWDELLQ